MVEPLNQTITQMSTKDYIELIIQASIAVGTILTAVIAVYGDQIRRRLFKPKIQIAVGQESPFIAVSRLASRGRTVSSTPYMVVKIKIKVVNTGSSSAPSFKGLIEAIWSKRSANDNTFFKLKDLSPSPLPWNSSHKEFSLTPKIPSYLEIARIEKREILSANVSENEAPALEYGLLIPIEENKGEYIYVGKGTFIIPITIYADNIDPIKKFFQVFWNGTNPDSIEASNFYIKMLQENDVPKDIKENL